MSRLCKRSITWAIWLCLVASTGCEDSTPQPRELVVLVGAGKGTTSINLFFPSTIRVRAGDTVTWRINTEGDAHTVTFTDDPEGLDDSVRRPGGEAWEWIINPDVALPTRGSRRTAGNVQRLRLSKLRHVLAVSDAPGCVQLRDLLHEVRHPRLLWVLVARSTSSSEAR